MGTVNDMKYRRTTARTDDHPTHVNIATARRLIFEQGSAPEGTHVEAILGKQSLTPHRVSEMYVRPLRVVLRLYSFT